jgi:hypothetical protein
LDGYVVRNGKLVRSNVASLIVPGQGAVTGVSIVNGAGSLLSLSPNSILAGHSTKFVYPDGTVATGAVGIADASNGYVTNIFGQSLIGLDGTTLIGLDGTTLIGLDGGTFISDHGSGALPIAPVISDHGLG